MSFQSNERRSIPNGARCFLSFHVLFYKIADHFVQLQHGVFGTRHYLAGGAAQLTLVLGGGHHAHSTQRGTRRHAQQDPGGLVGFVFHTEHSFP